MIGVLIPGGELAYSATANSACRGGTSAFLSVYLPLHTVVALALTIAWPTLRFMRANAGVNPLIPTRTGADSPNDYANYMLRAMWAVGSIVTVLYGVWPHAYDVLALPLEPLCRIMPSVRIAAGAFLSCAAVCVIAVGQYQMGRSWRVGIPDLSGDGGGNSGSSSADRTPTTAPATTTTRMRRADSAVARAAADTAESDTTSVSEPHAAPAAPRAAIDTPPHAQPPPTTAAALPTPPGRPQSQLHRTALVTHGLYRHTRHPIYFGLAVIQLSHALLTPSVVSVVCFVTGWFGVGMLTRLEETHMRALHGTAFDAYAKRTKRWWLF